MNPCVCFVCSVLGDDIYGLSLTGQESKAVCVRSTGALQEVNVDSWEKIRPWK